MYVQSLIHMFTACHSCLIHLRDIDQATKYTKSIQKSSKLHHSLRKNSQKTDMCFICEALRDPKQLRASKGNDNGSKGKTTWSVNSCTRSRTTQDGLCLRLQGREDNRQYLRQVYIWLPRPCTHFDDKTLHVAIREILGARANWPWGFPPFCQKVSWPFRVFMFSCSHVPICPSAVFTKFPYILRKNTSSFIHSAPCSNDFILLPKIVHCPPKPGLVLR